MIRTWMDGMTDRLRLGVVGVVVVVVGGAGVDKAHRAYYNIDQCGDGTTESVRSLRSLSWF